MSEELSAITAEVRKRGPGLFIRGVAMGSADLVPGVSGGTVAFITGIYDELVGTLAGVSARLLSRLVRGRVIEVAVGINAGFLIPLLAGVVTAIFTLARTIAFLMENHPLPFWGLLTGMMVASVVVVARRVEGWNLVRVAGLAVGAGIGYGVTIVVALQTGPELYKFALSAALASCAMILPGISGSYLLVLMGKYKQVLSAARDLDVQVLVTFVVGFVTRHSRLLQAVEVAAGQPLLGDHGLAGRSDSRFDAAYLAVQRMGGGRSS